MFLLRLVGQNAANRGNRKKSYYGFTTAEKSNHNIMYKTPICLYKIWYNRECDDICTLFLTMAKRFHKQKCICTLWREIEHMFRSRYIGQVVYNIADKSV